MKEHTWTIETINGHHLGDMDVWRCRACGNSGGPDLSDGKRTRPAWYDDIGTHLLSAPRGPFLPGPAMIVSLDCDEARQQARDYILGRIARLEKKSISPHYASLLKDAVTWSPDNTDWGTILDLSFDIEWGSQRPKLMAVRQRLMDAGFNVTPPALAAAVVALGEAMEEAQAQQPEDE